MEYEWFWMEIGIYSYRNTTFYWLVNLLRRGYVRRGLVDQSSTLNRCKKMTSLTPSLPVIPPEVFTVFDLGMFLGVRSYHRTSRGFGVWKPRVLQKKSKSWGTHHWGSKPESYVQGLGLLIFFDGQKIMCRLARLEKKMYRKKAEKSFVAPYFWAIFSRWWFQPNCKISAKLDHFPK